MKVVSGELNDAAVVPSSSKISASHVEDVWLIFHTISGIMGICNVFFGKLGVQKLVEKHESGCVGALVLDVLVYVYS